MTSDLDEAYFEWLCGQTTAVKLRKRDRTHWSLLRQLHDKEFVWFIPNDDNRLEDGRDLRVQFVEACKIDEPSDRWMALGCSMLELLIALSRRLAFETDGEARVWFWHMLEMIGLEQYEDRNYDRTAVGVIDETLNRVIYRQYAPDGTGGLFPLRNPAKDQRDVELWYQLNAYLNEL